MKSGLYSHRFEFLFRVGYRVSPIGHDQVVAEAEAAAMPPLRIVDHFAAPRLDHAGQHVGELRSADAGFRKNLRVVTADVLDSAQRPARLGVDQPVFRLRGDLFAVVEDHVGGVRQILRLAELAAGRLVKVFAGFLFLLGKVVPQLERLAVDAERGDARRGEVFVSGFGHQRELARHDRHDRLERHDVGMIADPSARGVLRVFVYVAPEVVAQDVQECRLGSGEEVLPDATASVEIVVVGDILLIFFPSFFHRIGLCLCFIPDRCLTVRGGGFVRSRRLSIFRRVLRCWR